MFSTTRFHSSQHSMGSVGLLGLCEVYKATNKWSKLNMDIIRHYQSAAVPQGFQEAWGFYWSVTRSQLLPRWSRCYFILSDWPVCLPLTVSPNGSLMSLMKHNDGQFPPLGPTMSFTQASRLSCGGILPQCVFRLQRKIPLQASMTKRQRQENHESVVLKNIFVQMLCYLGFWVTYY